MADMWSGFGLPADPAHSVLVPQPMGRIVKIWLVPMKMSPSFRAAIDKAARGKAARLWREILWQELPEDMLCLSDDAIRYFERRCPHELIIGEFWQRISDLSVFAFKERIMHPCDAKMARIIHLMVHSARKPGAMEAVCVMLGKYEHLPANMKDQLCQLRQISR